MRCAIPPDRACALPIPLLIPGRHLLCLLILLRPIGNGPNMSGARDDPFCAVPNSYSASADRFHDARPAMPVGKYLPRHRVPDANSALELSLFHLDELGVLAITDADPHESTFGRTRDDCSLFAVIPRNTAGKRNPLPIRYSCP